MIASLPAAGLDRPHVCVAGMGGIGGLLASLLAPHPLVLSVVARGETLLALQQRGLISSNEQTTTCHMLAAASRAPDKIQDLVILCGKYYHLPSLLKTVTHAIGPKTKIIPVVNGFPWWMAPTDACSTLHPILDPDGILSSLSPERLYGCVAYAFSQAVEPGHIRFSGCPRFLLGNVSDTGESTKNVLDILGERTAFFQESPDIRKDIWNKLSLNISSNFLSVLYESTLYELSHTAETRTLIFQSLKEMQALGMAYGLPDLPAPEVLIQKMEQGGAHPTSMLQDYQNNRPLELSAMGEAVLALAAYYAVPMPITEALFILTRRKAALRKKLPGPPAGAIQRNS